jgi:RNA polymerase sigma-70 factor (ECF subfamily)
MQNEHEAEKTRAMNRKVVPLRQPSTGPAPLSDEAVAAACAARDPAALAELFDRFHRRIARFLSRLVASQTDLEDLLQSTFLEVARGRATFQGRSSVVTWLLGIAANVARHHLRTGRRQARLHLALGRTENGQHTDSGPGEVVDARRALRRARRALALLPAERRLAFTLCELEGLSAQQAARALGTTESAVWKRFRRGGVEKPRKRSTLWPRRLGWTRGGGRTCSTGAPRRTSWVASGEQRRRALAGWRSRLQTHGMHRTPPC